MEAFGHERDATNSAVPTVLPPLALSNTTNPLVAVTNGYAVKASDGHRGADSRKVVRRASCRA
jgi:hypothetical protein